MSANDKTIRQQMEALQHLIDWFDSDDFVLEEAIEKYHEAEALAKTIDQRLNEVKNEITVLKEKFDS